MLVIGIAGGSGSGKTTVVKELVRQLPENSVSVISQDAYYYDNGDKTPEEKKQINFDHPTPSNGTCSLTILTVSKRVKPFRCLSTPTSPAHVRRR